MFFFLSRQGPSRGGRTRISQSTAPIRRSNSFASAATTDIHIQAKRTNVQEDIKIICWVFSSFMDENRTIIIIRPEEAVIGMLQLLLCNESKCVVDNATFLPHLSGRRICIPIVTPPRRQVKAYDCCVPQQQQQEGRRAAAAALLLRVLCSPCPSICCQITTSLSSFAGAKTDTCTYHSSSLADVHMIELMCCLWSINLKYTKPFARENSQPRIQTLQNTHSQSISIRHGRRQGILFAPSLPPPTTIKTERFRLANLIAHEHKTHYDISSPALPVGLNVYSEKSLCTMEMRWLDDTTIQISSSSYFFGLLPP